MIECIFTLDYEIYGNGTGSLTELVFEPARRLKQIFDEAGAKLVVFVEAAEFQKIEQFRTDRAIEDVKQQIQEFHFGGHEIGLHLHPQWSNAQYRNGKWELDYSEYNLCTLSEQRMNEIVGAGIAYLREVLQTPDFTPVSFRAGNWLFQPTKTAARVLAAHGIKIDSSVFKGGRQHKHGLDYRSAKKNGDHWRFSEDVTQADPEGLLLEMPTYTTMVPIWKMVTGKRIDLEKRGNSQPTPWRDRFYRLLDLARLRHPMKFDFCRMSFEELQSTLRVAQTKQASAALQPMVAIGHTKDLLDFQTVTAFLAHLHREGIQVSTLGDLYHRNWSIAESTPRQFSARALGCGTV